MPPTPRLAAVLVNDTRVDRHHGCTRVMRAIEALCAANGIRIAATAPAHRDWRLDTAIEAALESCDLVIVNGEGTIHHNRPMGEVLLAAGAAARARGKPAALINFSWQDNGPAFAAKLADFALVAARETRSATAIAPARPDCRVVPDLSFYLPVAPAPARRGVGFSDSVVRSSRLSLDRLRRAHGATSMPIRFSAPGLVGALRAARPYLSREDLRRPGEFVAAIAGLFDQWRHQAATDDAFVGRLAALELLVSGRFHGVTLALAARTPVLAVGSNTHKIEALLEDAGLAPWRMTDPESIDAAAIERAKAWTGDEAAKLDAYVNAGRAAAEALFGEIAALAR